MHNLLYTKNKKMKKLSKSQQEEFFLILKREDKKLDEIFLKIKLVKKEFFSTFELAASYYNDMKHFLDKKEYVKAFELQNYIWGILDSLAIMKAIEVPKDLQKHFKAEF